MAALLKSKARAGARLFDLIALSWNLVKLKTVFCSASCSISTCAFRLLTSVSFRFLYFLWATLYRSFLIY